MVTFRPVNPRNAVLEAVVLLHLNRPVFAPEAAALRALHPRLAHDLPRLDETLMANIVFGPAPPSVPPGAPVQMAAFKKDGTLETRLFLQGPLLAVNFLLYTRWDELWPKAAGWIRAVIQTLREAGASNGLPPFQVAMIGHQMINVFVWEGARDAVTAKELFAQKPSRLADAAWDASDQPWFAAHSTNQPLDLEGRRVAIVDLLSFDLSDEPPAGWRLRLDQTFEARLAQPIDPGDLIAKRDQSGPPLIHSVVNDLHERSRRLVRSLLRPEMLSRIGMEAL